MRRIGRLGGMGVALCATLSCSDGGTNGAGGTDGGPTSGGAAGRDSSTGSGGTTSGG